MYIAIVLYGLHVTLQTRLASACITAHCVCVLGYAVMHHRNAITDVFNSIVGDLIYAILPHVR